MLRQRYRLLQTVGQGGMGAVYVAQDTQLGDRLIAVKEMSMSRLAPQELPQAVEQFRREAHLLASLHHPNLPIIYEYFNASDRWYLVMSFVEGGTLQSALEAAPGRRLPLNEVVRIGLELCDVLNYLHNHQPQVIFRDLKPSNIMISPNGTVYLIDFGIARHFKQEQSKDTAYYYSVGYAPPEQYGQSQTGPRSDVYSLGATLHQMLSGHDPSSRPFQFPNLQLIDPTIPVPLTRLIAQMLEMNEQLRPASMAEVKAQLEKVQQPELITSTVQAGSTQDVQAKRAKSKASLSDQTSAVQSAPPAAQVEQVSPGLWSKIESLLSKNRLVAWICFIVLSLLMVWPVSLNIMYNDFFHGSSSDIWHSAGVWLFIASVGSALIGLISLFAKGRSWTLIFGGIALTLFGNLAIFTFVARGIYPDSIDNNTWRSIWLGFSLSYLTPAFLFCAFLLLTGTRLILRKASKRGSTLFGVLLICAGTMAASTVQDRLDQEIRTDFTYLLPLTTLTWLLTTFLGFVAIFGSRKRRPRMSEQAQKS
jgi:tRNA A-37 threonylcarbamoyl transferase component Bud32